MSGAGGWPLVNSRHAAFDAEKELSHLRPLLTARECLGGACAEAVAQFFGLATETGRTRPKIKIVRSRKRAFCG